MRLYLASVWIPGLGQAEQSGLVGDRRRAQGFWERALADPDTISQDWYAAFLQFMLDASSTPSSAS